MFSFSKHENVVEKRRFLQQIYIFFLIPIAIMLTSTFLVYDNYKKLIEKELKNSYISNLSALAENIDNSLNELQYTTLLLSSDSNLYDIFYSEKKLDSLDSYKIKAMMETLIKFRSTKSLIDNVYILHKESNEVLDAYGTYTADNYYERAANYEKYSKDFWMNFKVNTTFYQVLDPSILENRVEVPTKTNVIPFVTSNIGNLKSRNLFIINIKESELSNQLSKYKFTPGGKLCIINKKGTIFASTDSALKTSISNDKAFLQKISEKNNNYFEYNIDKNNNLVISFTTSNAKFNDFIYVAVIPYSDFTQKLSNIKILAYTIIVIGLIFSIVIAFFMSKKIYSPINNLISVLSKDNTDTSLLKNGEIDYLNNKVKEILINEGNLKKDLSIVMPLASEQYLTKILTNSDFIHQDDVRDFIQSDHINFKYTSFCSSILDLSFTEKYYNTYSNEDHQLVRRGISKLLGDIALGDYPTYVLNLNKNRLCVLINLPEDENLELISDNIKSVLNLLNYDKDLLGISVGIGRIYTDYVGMNKSYSEALKTLTTISPLSPDNIKIYSEINTTSYFHYSINDENKFYNYLVGCYKEEALAFLNSLIDKLYSTNPSEPDIKSFYTKLYNTILRVIEEKKLDPTAIIKEEFIDINSSQEILSINDLNAYIMKLTTGIMSISKCGNKLDISQIIEYINEHYKEDIYLEKLAEEFNTSDKYLSRLFKESLGTGFHDYLVSLRILNSKSLLLETDYSVTKVGEMVGFNTHSTFFRLFKKHEGINPTQYRENFKK
jgi:two-component system response regulator YesN